MMMFPPFFGFNPYYRRGYNKPYNSYVPKSYDEHKFYNSQKEEHTNNSNRNNNIKADYPLKNDFMKNNNKMSNNFNTFSSKSTYSKSNFSNDKNTTENIRDEYSPFFNIFGIDLYFDDILILGLLLFLNSEDVKDSYLYIVLIMLLFN